MHTLIRAFFGQRKAWLLLFGFSAIVGPCRAEPEIEGYDLVGSTRVDRTTFDYSYRLRIRGDQYVYSDAKVTVATRSVVTGTVVTKPVVTLGQLDAGVFLRPAEAFTVRQDRTTPFNPSTLTFTFTGTRQAGTIDTPGGTRIGQVYFADNRGRPGHEGTTRIQGNVPQGGATLGLVASVFGIATSVSYQMFSAAGSLLAQGSMTPFFLSRYGTVVTVPTQPFRLHVVTTSANGSVNTWTSGSLVQPAPLSIRILPASGAVKRGEAIDLEIEIASGTVSGLHRISLLLPIGFSAGATMWNVNLSAGRTTKVSTTILAPLSAESMSFTSLVATIAAASAAAASPLEANIQLMIE